MYPFPNTNAFYADHYATAQQQQPYMQQAAPAPPDAHRFYVDMPSQHDHYDQSMQQPLQQLQEQQPDAHWQENLQHAQQYLLPVQQLQQPLLQQPHERLGCSRDELDKFQRMRRNYMSIRRMREAQQKLTIGTISHSVDRPVKFTPASASRDRRAAAYAKQLMEQQPSQEVDWTPIDNSDHTQYAQAERQHSQSVHKEMDWTLGEPQQEPLQTADELTTAEQDEMVTIDDDYEELTRAAKMFLSDLPMNEGQCSQVPKEETTCETVAHQPGAEARITAVSSATTDLDPFADFPSDNDEQSRDSDSSVTSNSSEPSVNQEMGTPIVKEFAKGTVFERNQTIAMLVDEIKRMERSENEKADSPPNDATQENAPIVDSKTAVEEQHTDSNDEATLEGSRDERMKLYETGHAFKKFPQLEKNTNLLLSDLAASVEKTLPELIADNDKLWDALGKIKDHLKKEDVKACEDASDGDPDFLNLLYLIAFLNGSRRNAKIDRVGRLYTKMNFSSPAVALATLVDSNMNQPLAFKCSNLPSLYLSLDGRAIPVEKGGLRMAVLSVVAGTHLLNLAIDQQVGDVVRFFYSAAGLELLRKPVAVAKAREIIGV